MGESARSLALAALVRIDHEGAYANLVLPAMLSRSTLSDADRRFATELVYGTTRMRRACDALVDRFVMSEPDATTRTLLRLGAYQLAFAKVAPHAAVSATVDLASRKTSGFVNAVLRKVSTKDMVWGSEATRLSYPDWITELFARECGDEARRDRPLWEPTAAAGPGVPGPVSGAACPSTSGGPVHGFTWPFVRPCSDFHTLVPSSKGVPSTVKSAY